MVELSSGEQRHFTEQVPTCRSSVVSVVSLDIHQDPPESSREGGRTYVDQGPVNGSRSNGESLETVGPESNEWRRGMGFVNH